MTERRDVPPSMTPEELARRIEAKEKAEQEATRARAEHHDKEAAKRVWTSEGGTEAGFEREWPTLRAETLRERVAAREAQRRRASDSYYENTF